MQCGVYVMEQRHQQLIFVGRFDIYVQCHIGFHQSKERKSLFWPRLIIHDNNLCQSYQNNWTVNLNLKKNT